jgi:hypothetical protein
VAIVVSLIVRITTRALSNRIVTVADERGRNITAAAASTTVADLQTAIKQGRRETYATKKRDVSRSVAT